MILIISRDEKSSLKQMEQLKKLNYKALYASCPLEAVTLSQENEDIKLVLLDMDTIPEPAALLGEVISHRDLPVICTTLHSEVVDGKAIPTDLCYGYIPKNTSDFILHNNIQTALAFSNLRQEAKTTSDYVRQAEKISNFGYWEFHLSSGVVKASQGAKKIYGLSEGDYSIPHIQSFPLPEYRPILDKAMKELIEDGLPYDVEFKIRNNIDKKVISIHSLAEYNPERNIVMGTIYDISRQKEAEERAVKKEREFRGIVENHNAVMLIIDSDSGEILMANNSASKFYKWTLEELKGMKIQDINILDPMEVKAEMDSAISGGKGYFSFKHRLADGSIRSVDVFSGSIIFEGRNRLFSIIHDATKREEANKKIEYMAYHDSLTGLPNRKRFSDDIKKLTSSSEGDSSFALLNIDLDHFKEVNDNYGHYLGDLLLIEAAKRLNDTLRDSGTAYRLGGDEFTILTDSYTASPELSDLSVKILNTLKNPFIINRRKLFISASIGIAVYPHNGRDINTLFKNSDAAMYLAKRRGKNRYCFF